MLSDIYVWCVFSPVGIADVQYSGHIEHGVSDACEYRGFR